MKVRLTRNTGFFGMASPLKVIKNNQVAALLANDSSAEFEVLDAPVALQVKFAFLTSEVLTLTNEQAEKKLAVTVNPNIFKLYVSVFTLFFFLPIFFKSWTLGAGIVVVYILFVLLMSRKFYLIKELD